MSRRLETKEVKAHNRFLDKFYICLQLNTRNQILRQRLKRKLLFDPIPFSTSKRTPVIQQYMQKHIYKLLRKGKYGCKIAVVHTFKTCTNSSVSHPCNLYQAELHNPLLVSSQVHMACTYQVSYPTSQRRVVKSYTCFRKVGDERRGTLSCS